MKNYILNAKTLIDTADKEFLNLPSLSFQRKLESTIRQVAEKGWLAATEAVNGLLQKRGIKIPKGTRKREDLLLDLEDKDKKIKNSGLGDKYIRFLHNLHCECFYDGDVSKKRVQRDLRRVREFIVEIEKMSRVSP